MADYVARMWTIKNTYKVFVKKLKWNRQFGRTIDRWYNYIKIHVDEIVCEDVDWFHLIQLGSSGEPL